MVQLEQTKTRAKAVYQVDLDTEKEKDDTEQEVQRLSWVLVPWRGGAHEDWTSLTLRVWWSTGNDTSCENHFNLSHHTWEDYRGTSFYKQDRALVIKQWLNRVEEDASGLTFQEWTVGGCWHITTTCDYDDQLKWITLSWFQDQGSVSSSTWASARGGFRTRGSGLRNLEDMGPKRFVLSVDDDTEFRSRCEWIIPFFTLKYSIFAINLFKIKKIEGGCPTPQDDEVVSWPVGTYFVLFQ